MRGTEKIINLTAVKSNYLLMDGLAPNSQTLAVIKADAYGHGAVEIASCLTPIAPAFAVAFLEEAIPLREKGIDAPILLLEGAMSADETVLAAQQGCWLMVHAAHQIPWLLASPYPKETPVWVKVDTGMGRLGFFEAQLADTLTQLKKAGYRQIILCSHCSSADEPQANTTLQQASTIQQLAQQHQLPFSLSNSAGVLLWPETHGQWNRSGIALYGASPSGRDEPKNSPLALTPVMTLQSSILAIRPVKKGAPVGYNGHWTAPRDCLIATVAIGYGDGYPRHAPSGTPVMINGVNARLVGRVSMDMITVDVTDVPGVTVGATVQLWGEALSVSDVAACAGTINYELLTRVSPRVKATYLTS
jgi:alanine racemase